MTSQAIKKLTFVLQRNVLLEHVAILYILSAGAVEVFNVMSTPLCKKCFSLIPPGFTVFTRKGRA